MEEQVYQLFSEIQTTHWWFVARRSILEDILKRQLKSTGDLHIADIGCGAGALLPMLAQFGEAWGVDGSAIAVEMCRRKNFTNVYLDDDPAWRQIDFDVMAFLDVIEHVDDDAEFLKKYIAHLKPGGLVLITVPALMLLWSDHDKLNHHRRRYTARRLQEVVEQANLMPERITYFNTWLFPGIAFVRLAMRIKHALQKIAGLKNQRVARTDFERNIFLLNGVFKAIFASERFFLRHFSFPIGTSLLCIARAAQPAKMPATRESLESRI